MFNIKDDVIYLTRGDSATIDVELVDSEGSAIEMQEGDLLTFSVRETTGSEEASVVINSAIPSIVIRPDDTKDLAIGQYSCDIQLTTADGKVHTVFPDLDTKYLKRDTNWKNFWITPEVTR